MTYTHIATDELVIIESNYKQSAAVAKIAKLTNHSRQTIYNLINFFKEGGLLLEYYQRYKKSRKLCGRSEIVLLDV